MLAYIYRQGGEDDKGSGNTDTSMDSCAEDESLLNGRLVSSCGQRNVLCNQLRSDIQQKVHVPVLHI